MKYHDVFEVSRQIVAPFFLSFDYFYCSTEFGEHLREVESCFTAAYYHDLLQVCIFAALVDFRIESQDRAFFTDDIYEILGFDDFFSVRDYDFSIS